MFRAAFVQAEIGLAVLDDGGTRLREANPALCALLGYPAGALKDHPFADLLAPGEEPGEGIRSWRRADGAALDVRVRRNGPVLTVEAVDPDAAAHSEENREALAAAGLGEWRWERASGRVILSRRAGQILGHPAGTAPTWATRADRPRPSRPGRSGSRPYRRP
ncbi:PAS domain-containing protein [Methylobacterium hispanicum]|uniref:PAS domain-containing protein n=1 Tax=Methylobacterium hispanicum TaxID=270350 RepID=UPI002F2E30B0